MNNDKGIARSPSVKRSLPIVLTITILVASLLPAACGGGTSCSVTQQKLAALREGMTYQEVVGVMGCEGTIAGTVNAGAGAVVGVRWNGPGNTPYSYTLVQFNDRRLAGFTASGG